MDVTALADLLKTKDNDSDSDDDQVLKFYYGRNVLNVY